MSLRYNGLRQLVWSPALSGHRFKCCLLMVLPKTECPVKAEVVPLHFHGKTIYKDRDVKEREAYPDCITSQECITDRSN